MRNPARIALLLTLLLCAAGSTLAQSPTDFYLGLLGRGASYVEAGQYDAAVSPLRISAFGLVESISNYQSALVYLAIAQDRAGNSDGARDAVRRLASAERIERHFGSLQLPAAIRSAFLDVAKKHLAAADANALANGGAISAAPKTQPTVTTRPAPPTTQPQPTPSSSTATTTPQQQPPTATPAQTQPAKPQPQTTKPAEPKPAPTTTPAQQQPKKTADAKPAESKPTVPQTTTSAPPAVKPPAPQPATTTTTPAPAQTKPALSAKDVATRMAAAERALTNAQLTEARRLYRELLDAPGLDRDSLLRIVEGLYRARDFNGALAAFKALGTLRRGEEPYSYYQAVALYETGAYEQARKVLSSAIPFIEMTPDVVRYRTKIEGAH